MFVEISDNLDYKKNDFSEILNIPWIGEGIYNRDFEYNVIGKSYVARGFKTIWIKKLPEILKLIWTNKTW